MKYLSKFTLVLFYLTMIPLLFIGNCATFPDKGESNQDSKLTVGIVKQEIIKGETTQAEILETFGSPNIITKNREDNEVWNYNRMSYEKKEGSDGAYFIFGSGSRAMSTATTKSFDLIITFDDNEIVKDYSVISASF